MAIKIQIIFLIDCKEKFHYPLTKTNLDTFINETNPKIAESLAFSRKGRYNSNKSINNYFSEYEVNSGI